MKYTESKVTYEDISSTYTCACCGVCLSSENVHLFREAVTRMWVRVCSSCYTNEQPITKIATDIIHLKGMVDEAIECESSDRSRTILREIWNEVDYIISSHNLKEDD